MRNISELIGIIKGINFDGVINDMEVLRLQSWVNKNRNLAYESKHVEMIKIVDSILEDHIIDKVEREILLDLSEQYLNIDGCDEISIYELIGIIEGIVCDGEVNREEVLQLKNWMSLYGNAIRTEALNANLCKAIDNMLMDDVITQEEQQQLLVMLSDRITDSQFETKLSYLCKQVKAKKNIGIDLIDMLDNDEAMDEIHKRAIAQLKSTLSSYSGTLIRDSEVVFISLCLIGMLDYNGSFYDSVRVVYKELYSQYSQQKIEGLIRTVLDRYRTEEERNKVKGVKNAIISVVLSNAIVTAYYLGAFFEFVYDIYKINFEYDLPSDLNEEFKFVYDGLRSSMMSDGDNIQDNVTKKTYKLIKTTKQLIADGKYIDSVIKLSIIIVKLIDQQIWKKGVKIYNPYLKVGFAKWITTLKDEIERSSRRQSEWHSRWEPKYILDENNIYLVPPVHKIKSEYNYWDIYVQVLCDGRVVYEEKEPDIREIIAGYKVSPNKIKIENPLSNLSYRLKSGENIIYDSKEKLYRHYIVFDQDGFEIQNNTDYKGTAVFCCDKEMDKYEAYHITNRYKLASKNVKQGDTYFVGEEVFNFSSLIKPGILGDDYENLYIAKSDLTEKIKVYREIKYLVFECENHSNNFEIYVNEKLYKISDFSYTTIERGGVCKYTIDLPIYEVGIYDVTVNQILYGKRKRIAYFCFALDTGYLLQYNKLDDSSFVYDLYSDLIGRNINNRIELALFSDDSISFEYRGKKYYYIIPFDLGAYRLSGAEWKTLSDEIWIGDINNDTVLDVYDCEIDEFIVYSSVGRPLETVIMKDKGVYKQAAIGFLCSYKEEYDFVFIVFLKKQKVKRAVFCNNKCQMREDTEIIYDTVSGTLRINPWFYGRGNVCCEIFSSTGESVFKKDNLINDEIIEIKDLASFEKYTIVFTEKAKGLGLALKKNREMKRFTRTFYAREDLVGREFKISEISYEVSNSNTDVCMLSKSYIRLLEKKPNGSFIAEIYKRDTNSFMRSNLVKDVDVEICSDVINGNMEIIIFKKDQMLTYDKMRNHVTDSALNKGGYVVNYTVIV